MRFVGRCYRGHDPSWSFSPLSGDGASKAGGRFNRKGEPALYLSLEIMTAVGECSQGLAQRLLPLTMCEYNVDCEPVADLRDAAGRAAHGVAPADLACAWLQFQRKGQQAASWLATDRIRAAGHCGMLVPSFFPGAAGAHHNLVLWRWGPDLPCRVQVHDPTGRLPKNRRSWA